MSTRHVPATLGLALLTVLLLSACRQDMHDQPKVNPLAASDFFADGRGSRDLVEGTVARGMLQADSLLYRGREVDGRPAAVVPLEVDRELLERGRFLYDGFCSPCHDRVGTGEGMVVQRGFPPPPSLHEERLRNAPPGYTFQVITSGFGQMASYASEIPPRDRWAIVAYIQALQLSQDARLSDVEPAQRRLLEIEGE